MDTSMYLLFLATSSPLLILAIVFLTIGLRRSGRIKHWLPTEGVIIKKEKSINIRINIESILKRSFIADPETIPDKKPTFAYTVDGVEYEKTSIIGQNPGIRPGKAVNVLYDPRDPKDATIDTFVQRGTIFTIIGSIFLALYILIAAFFTVIWNFT